MTDSASPYSSLFKATLVKRYKRFLADVILNGEIITVHCPNTGAMTHCIEPAMTVWLSYSSNPKRKYAYTWEFAVTAQGDWIGVHSARANKLVLAALQYNCIAELTAYEHIQPEVAIRAEFGSRSRIDFKLTAPCVDDCYMEVKSVTLRENEGLGFFPDAKSDRGIKHLQTLQALCEQGNRAVMLYCVQHSGIDSVSPADHIDPRYGAAMRLAKDAGVEFIAYRAELPIVERQAVDLSDYQLTTKLPLKWAI